MKIDRTAQILEQIDELITESREITLKEAKAGPKCSQFSRGDRVLILSRDLCHREAAVDHVKGKQMWHVELNDGTRTTRKCPKIANGVPSIESFVKKEGLHVLHCRQLPSHAVLVQKHWPDLSHDNGIRLSMHQHVGPNHLADLAQQISLVTDVLLCHQLGVTMHLHLPINCGSRHARGMPSNLPAMVTIFSSTFFG